MIIASEHDLQQFSQLPADDRALLMCHMDQAHAAVKALRKQRLDKRPDLAPLRMALTTLRGNALANDLPELADALLPDIATLNLAPHTEEAGHPPSNMAVPFTGKSRHRPYRVSDAELSKLEISLSSTGEALWRTHRDSPMENATPEDKWFNIRAELGQSWREAKDSSSRLSDAQLKPIIHYMAEFLNKIPLHERYAMHMYLDRATRNARPDTAYTNLRSLTDSGLVHDLVRLLMQPSPTEGFVILKPVKDEVEAFKAKDPLAVPMHELMEKLRYHQRFGPDTHGHDTGVV